MKTISIRHFLLVGFNNGLILIGILLGFGIFLPLTTASAIPEQSASITISPTSGPPRTEVTITATGFLTGTSGEVRWDGETRQTFDLTTSDFVLSFTVPGRAAAGVHTITVCGNCYGFEFVDMVSAEFTVTIPATSTPTPTLQIIPGITLAPIVPPTFTPTIPPTDLPSVCGDLGLGSDAVVIDFDSLSPGQVLTTELEGSYHIAFEASLKVLSPSVAPHSGTLAGSSVEVGDFGSTDLPIRMRFSQGVRAIGMFVGLQENYYAASPITATLTAYGYRDGTSGLILLSSRSVTFPAVPLDIEHCLSLAVSDTEVITFATLEYRDADGRSTYEWRLLDDLTLVFTEHAIPVDSPPTVTITSPDDNQVFSGGDISLVAEIREDRRLAVVNYRIQTIPESGPAEILSSGSIAASPSGADPTLYHTLLTFSVESVLPPETPVAISVTAVDGSGLTGSDQVTVIYSPPPTLDIRYYQIEITQAVQCMQNPVCGSDTVPLYQNKPTLVRIYLTANEGPVPDVTGYINVYQGDSFDYTTIYPIAPITVEASADPVSDFRGDLSKTLNFFLPPELIENPVTLRMDIVINPTHSPEECCYENNLRGVGEIRIQRSKTLYLVFVPISSGGTQGSLNDIWHVVDWLSRVYPIYDFRTYRTTGALWVPDLAVVDSGCGQRWTNILNHLWLLNLFTSDPGDYTRYYGLVARDFGNNIIGCGKNPGDEAAGMTILSERNTGVIAAHEIGHNHGRNHAPCPGSGAAGVDGSYPDAGGLTDEYGTDVMAMQIYDPSYTYDFMSYCGSEYQKWVSRYTYLGMANAIGSVAFEPDQLAGLNTPSLTMGEEQEYLVATGGITPNGISIDTGFYRLMLPEGTQDNLPQGPYTVELLDADDTVLFSREFGPVVMTALSLDGNEDPQPIDPLSGTLQIILPWNEGANSVAFKYAGIEISRFTASPGIPVIELLSPNGGEDWGAAGEETISWESSDPDGDELSYTVQYSPDGGLTWTALVIDTQNTEMTVDLSDLAGGETALVRVVTSDGFNTSTDSSDASFLVAEKPPEAYIASPQDGNIYLLGQPIYFQGYATDLEDGAIINPDAFSWLSDRDGELGFGDQLIIQSLSEGRHTITLHVEDSSGLTGEFSTTIVVGEDPSPRFTMGPLLGIGLAVLLLIGLGILGYLILNMVRRRTAG